MASPKIVIQVEGADELAAKLRRIGQTVNSEKFLTEVLMEGAKVLQERLEARAPRLSGQLAESVSISKKGREKVSVRVGPDKTGFYGRFHEYGTSRMPARPWMRPVFDAEQEEVERVMTEALWLKVEELL